MYNIWKLDFDAHKLYAIAYNNLLNIIYISYTYTH